MWPPASPEAPANYGYVSMPPGTVPCKIEASAPHPWGSPYFLPRSEKTFGSPRTSTRNLIIWQRAALQLMRAGQ